MNLFWAARAVVFATAFALASAAGAQTRINSSPNDGDTGKPPVKPAKQHVFVRGWDSDRKKLEFVAADSILPKADWYGEQLKEFPGKSLDILMQQCFGGGFIDNIIASRNDFTVATAADWYEKSNGYAPLKLRDNLPYIKEMEDFTRPWWQDALAHPNDGMLTHFNTVRQGSAASEIARDVFFPPGKTYVDKDGENQLAIEHPQFASTGNAADARKISDNNYAIFVQWGTMDYKAQFEIQMARMFQALTDAKVGKIPPKNIAILFGDLNKDDKIGGQKLDDDVQLPELTVTGPTTRDNWLAALKGDIFGPDNKPNADARIFIYNNGHGGLQKPDIQRETGNAMNGAPTHIYKVGLTGFDVSPVSADGSIYTLNNPDEMVSVQIAAAHPITASMVQVNGSPFSLGPELGDGSLIRSVEAALPSAFADSTLAYYELRVPHQLLALNPSRTRFEFFGLDDPTAIRAFDFAGGTQELLNVVPEPATLALLLAAAAILATSRSAIKPRRRSDANLVTSANARPSQKLGYWS